MEKNESLILNAFRPAEQSHLRPTRAIFFHCYRRLEDKRDKAGYLLLLIMYGPRAIVTNTMPESYHGHVTVNNPLMSSLWHLKPGCRGK